MWRSPNELHLVLLALQHYKQAALGGTGGHAVAEDVDLEVEREQCRRGCGDRIFEELAQIFDAEVEVVDRLRKSRGGGLTALTCGGMWSVTGSVWGGASAGSWLAHLHHVAVVVGDRAVSVAGRRARA